MSHSEPIERWRRRGATHRVRGMDVFYVREGRGSTVVVLHGFPTSSYDWSAVLPALSSRHDVLLFDLPGFGFSAKPAAYSYATAEHSDVAAELCAALGIADAHLVAHDMGLGVLCELLARRAEGRLALRPRSVTLVNGSLYPDLARPTPAQRILARSWLGPAFARLATRAVFKLQFRGLFGHPEAVPDAELDRLWEVLSHDDGLKRLPRIVGYLHERVTHASRWQSSLAGLDVPALVLWGRRDRASVFAMAERLAQEIPASKLLALDTLGHYPHIEDPARVADALNGFLDAVDGER